MNFLLRKRRNSTVWFLLLMVISILELVLPSNAVRTRNTSYSHITPIITPIKGVIEPEDGLQINMLPPPSIFESNDRSGDSLTILELLMLSKLQNYVEDFMGIGKFQEPFWTTTSFLTNLLEASHWSLKKAKHNFRKSVELRMKHMQAMQEIPEPNLFDDFYAELNGYDKEGCKVINLPAGEWRTYRSYLEKSKSLDKATHNLKIYFRNLYETVFNHVQNKKCSQIVLIVDLKGYSKLHNSGLRFFIDAIKDFGKTYPGILKMVYLINAPPAFLSVAKSFKTTIPWDIRRKAYIFTERAFWEYPINQIIDPSQLPMKLGGTNIFLS